MRISDWSSDVCSSDLNAGITLRAGFTTVREAGSAQYTAYALRRGTANGFIEGPRIVAAGPALSIIGGHGDVTGFREDVHDVLASGYTSTGALECAEKVRKASRAAAAALTITQTRPRRSEERRVWQEGVSTCACGWVPE